MISRSAANMSRTNSETSLFSSYVCGMVSVYQFYMVSFATMKERPVVGCNLVVLCWAYNKATALNVEFFSDIKWS